jgi:hypothetical protein
VTHFKHKNLKGDTIHLDGNSYEDCTVIYSGGEMPVLIGNNYSGRTTFAFEGAADRQVLPRDAKNVDPTHPTTFRVGSNRP